MLPRTALRILVSLAVGVGGWAATSVAVAPAAHADASLISPDIFTWHWPSARHLKQGRRVARVPAAATGPANWRTPEAFVGQGPHPQR
jgi:hypothetical protein